MQGSDDDQSITAALNNANELFGGTLHVCNEIGDRNGWINNMALRNPNHSALSPLVSCLAAMGFGANRRAISASIMLRLGWAAGPVIAAYLSEGRVLRIGRYALKFSQKSMVRAICINEVDSWCRPQGERLDSEVLDSLIDFSEPVLAGHHHWSGYSRHALWAMIASSWLAQFAAIGHRLGRRRESVRAGRRMLKRHHEIARALPETYEIGSDGKSGTCQILKACCLYHKGRPGHFCPSCPVISERVRFLRNRKWVCRNPN